MHSASKIHQASLSDLSSLIGPESYAKSEDELLASYNSTTTIPQLLFLGLDEAQKSGFEHGIYAGSPYFALDITPKGSYADAATAFIEAKQKEGLSFLEGRASMTLPAPQAAMYAQARALLDWNARNPFCGGCGQPTLSINAGWKRACPSTDLADVAGSTGSAAQAKEGGTAGEARKRADCVTRKGVSNLSFPRTDPTVIMAVLSADSQRVLLGRGKRFPPLWYSTLAGFVEPAESIEEAVRREVWEESGITLGRVVVHSSQPWPYPANLMIGCVAQAVPGGEEILLKHDPELEDAKWVGLEEVREALRIGTSRLDEGPGEEYKEGGLRLPPRTAIAHMLLDSIVNGGFLSGVTKV